jgi:hypothetical protein
VKLPDFWMEDRVSWFKLAEGQFSLQKVVDQVARYYHMLFSLSQDAFWLIQHMLHEEIGPDSYDNLRTSLLVSHFLSNYQKMERIMKLRPLGHCKPSVMLAGILEYCPVGKLAPPCSPTCFFSSFLVILVCSCAPSLPEDLMVLAAAQASCPDCQWVPSSSSLRVSTFKMQDTSTGWDGQSWTVFCGPAAVAVGGCERKD